ncbi:MAG: 4Fe-4S binding protein [Actinomycetota bacterium]
MVLFTKELWAKIGWLFYAKMSLLFFFLIWMIFSKRPFCRTICPLGTIFSLFNRFSFLQLKVDLSSCNLCGECQRICPVDIKVYEHPNSVNSLRCIRCLECTSCPHISWSFK